MKNAARNPHSAWLMLFAAAWLALAPLPSGAQTAAAAPDRAESFTLPGKAGETSASLKAREAGAAPAPRKFSFAPVSKEKLAAESALQTQSGKPHKIGFGRDIAELADAADTAAALNWQPTAAGGQAAAISLTSPQAAGMRAGILVRRLPEDATLRFYPHGAGAVYEIPARDILAALQRNREAGETGIDARTYWSPHVEGEEMTVEIELPPGIAADALEISIPRISHIFKSPFAAAGESQITSEAAASCNLDVSCQPGWIGESNATARIVFVDSGATYLCTGTLLADTTASRTPYFLTANHCISTQTAASTLQSYWFYRSTACNSGILNPGYQTLVGGATLLYASGLSDTSFMRLLDTPPAGAAFAGWLGAAAPIGSATMGVHHPKGDLQKITTGQVGSYLSCSPNPSAGCTTSVNPALGDYLNIPYTAGITEGGSSGSGLYIASGSNHYLIGQLYGSNVNSDCSAADKMGAYGRFDVAYSAALHNWLNSSATPSLTVIKAGSGSGTVASAPAGINCGATCSASFASGTGVSLSATPGAGYVFSGWGGACSGAAATCALTLNASSSVTATFSLPSATLGPALDNPTLAWTTGGDAPFAVQAATAFAGGSAAQSGAIGSSQDSWLATTVTGPGTLTWYWSVSSEKDFDLLGVSVDGVLMASISGQVGWTKATLNIPAGTHAVRWDYAKDVSLSSGQDAGWIDDVLFAPSVLAPAANMLVYLEEPVGGGNASGVGNIRGWAVSSQAIQRVDLYIDGGLAATLPYGGSRPDVGAAYPGYPGSANSGFSMAYSFGGLAAGSHVFTARAIDTLGGYLDSTATANIVRFPTSFISNPADINVLSASLAPIDANSFRLNNVIVQSVPYNLSFRWNTASQSFAMTAIASVAPFASPAATAGSAANAYSPQAAANMLVYLEEPVNGGNASGVGNIRGWAVSSQAIQRVDLYIDGGLAATLPYGGSRPDVGAAYPGYPGSANSGFSMAYSFGGLAAGSHVFTARAIDNQGGFLDSTASANIVRFPTSFISNPADINVLSASLAPIDANSFRLNNVIVQSVPYNLSFRWNTASQSFAMTGNK